MAVAIVREKELGSIINLYVTPVTRIEFLAGKQLPYIVVAMGNFIVLFLMALFLFGVPLKGSFATLALGRCSTSRPRPGSACWCRLSLERRLPPWSARRSSPPCRQSSSQEC
jgi:hypothetical protein